MRFKVITVYFLILFVVLLKVVLLYYFVFRLFVTFETESTEPPIMATKTPTKHLSKMITVIIRDFELYENDVMLTAQSFLNIFPSIQIFILHNELPYPPIDIMFTNNSVPNIKFINLSPSLKTSFMDNYPVTQIKTNYVLFVPDSTRVNSRQSMQVLINELSKRQGNIVVAPVRNQKKSLTCLNMNVNIREWVLKYNSAKGLECDGISGKHVILMESDNLRKLPNAFIEPFPESLYIQTTVFNLRVNIIKGLSFHDGKPVLRSHHAQWKHKQAVTQRLKKFYQEFGIKQVIRETGATEWYGCSKETARCFGTVLDSMPSYLFERKWTPPCCLSNLRKTARHVFNNLEEAGVRYWLEAGSLLGAMRSGDILPWDHNVDVGFIREDLLRCTWLKKAKDKPIVDSKGFLWEKATEGNFFRVHFSKTNRIHVNLFPFYSKNGTMTKDSWFTSHKKMEFPENYLHPMSSIEFAGRSVPSPNNIRDFLELKFGKGAIENPEYPEPNKLHFP